MSGEWFALLTVCSWSIGIFPFTEATRRLGAMSVNTWRLFFALLFVFIILFFLPGLGVSEIFHLPKMDHYLWFGLSGLIGFTLGDFFGFTSFARLGPKLGSLYTTLAPGVALLTAWLFLGESISLIGILGIGISLGGVVLLTLSGKDKQSAAKSGFQRDKFGVISGVLSAVCQGIGLVISKHGFSIANQQGEPIHAIQANFLRLLAATVGGFLFIVLRGQFKTVSVPVLQNQKNGLPFMLAGTLFGPVIGVCLSLYAVNLIPVSVAQTIFSLLPVLILPLSYFIYKESIHTRAIIACLISIIGVIILIWRDSIAQVLSI